MFCLLLTMIVIFTRTGKASPSMRFSTRFTGHLYNRVAGVSFQTCVDKCQNVAGCQSVNYERRTQTCEINSRRVSDIPNLNTAAGGFVYWEKHYVDETLTCEGSLCSRHESCDRRSGTCNAYACEPYISPAYGTVLGNRNDVNSTVRVKCNSDDVIPARSHAALCGASGTWGDIASCEPTCSHGWSRFGQSCYRFSTTQYSWDGCKTYCESIGTRLVIVNDLAEHEFLKEKSSGSSGTGRPGVRIMRLVVVWPDTVGIVSTACIESSSIKCLKWTPSPYNRKNVGGTLNPTTTKYIFEIRGVAMWLNGVWIGLKYIGSSFLWVDGSQLTFSMWYRKILKYHNCVRMYAGYGYLWKDSYYCYWAHRCVCEKEIDGHEN